MYEKPTTIRKRKKAAAVKRSQKKLQRDMPQPRDPRMRMKKTK
jgi:ribosomal protein S21